MTQEDMIVMYINKADYNTNTKQCVHTEQHSFLTITFPTIANPMYEID